MKMVCVPVTVNLKVGKLIKDIYREHGKRVVALNIYTELFYTTWDEEWKAAQY